MATEPQPERKDLDPTDAYIYLAAGVLGGLVLLLHPLFYISWWWQPLYGAMREGTRNDLWKPGLVLASVLAALGVMFACFQAARKYERTDATLRRVLYGYNSGLTLLLVFVLLFVVNLFIRFGPQVLDATEGGFHSVSEVTQRFVSEIDRPVKVYVVMSAGYEVRSNMLALVSQLHDINPRYFDYEAVSPTLNDSRNSDLRKKFPQFTGEGAIVSYGEKEDNYSFIPINELENSDLDPMGQSQSRSFNGEVRLLQELMYLAENKKQPVIYVLQGHGEPDEAGAGQTGLSSLRLKLMQTKYDVRTLKFPADLNPEAATVPADADVVLVVGPTRPLANAVPALRKYLSPADPGKPKGKLVALIGPTPADPQNGNKMKETGIEALLREYNVDVTNEQILTLAIPQADGFVLAPSPQLVIVSPMPEAIDARQPLAQTFQRQPLNWFDCRKVQPSRSQSAPGGPTYNAQTIMGSYGVVWTETDMAADIGRQRQNLLQNAAAQRQKATEEAQPVMVAVTETAGGPHGSPGEQKPRIVVIGTSSIATNQFQGGQRGLITFDLIRGCIDWCRERTANIGVQPKTHSSYILPRVSYARLFWVPSFAMLVGIFGFGMIIWNMRKR